MIDREVMDIYNKHYLTVSQPVSVDEDCKETLPAALLPCFKEAVREKCRKNWCG